MWARLVSILSGLTLLALFVAAVLFKIHNDTEVTLDLYVHRMTEPLAHVVLAAFASGIGLGWIVSVVSGWLWRGRRRRRQREAQANRSAMQALGAKTDGDNA
jgi:uncharacterized integral membrane protein